VTPGRVKHGSGEFVGFVEVLDFTGGDVRQPALGFAFAPPADFAVLRNRCAFGGGADEVSEEGSSTEVGIWLVDRANGTGWIGVVPLGDEEHGRIERFAGSFEAG